MCHVRVGPEMYIKPLRALLTNGAAAHKQNAASNIGSKQNPQQQQQNHRLYTTTQT